VSELKGGGGIDVSERERGEGWREGEKEKRVSK